MGIIDLICRSSDAQLIIKKNKKNSHAQSTESNETEQVTGHSGASASAGATYSCSVVSGRTMGTGYTCNTKTKDSENSSKRSSTSSDEIEVNEPIPTSNYTLNVPNYAC